MPGGLKPHHGVADGQSAHEQHDEQQHEVEVVGARRLEDGLVRYIAGEHRPATNVHQNAQLDRVDGRKAG